jgi:undecaprenyl-diphosphatase
VALLYILILAVVQGLAELLPVSSSAHVVVAEKLLALDPSSPQMTLLLVMLHTGTMFAVIVYFWRQWRDTYFQNMTAFKKFAGYVVLATALTGLVGEAIIKVIEKTFFGGFPHAQIEDLFSHLELVAPALALVGILILVAGIVDKKKSAVGLINTKDLSGRDAGIIGAVQGLCLPFRGFSRSGATISAGMLLGVAKSRAEMFSFALAVVLTPIVVAREVMRVVHAEQVDGMANFASATLPSLFGAVFAFLAGLLALKWLSRWLDGGRWYRHRLPDCRAVRRLSTSFGLLISGDSRLTHYKRAPVWSRF